MKIKRIFKKCFYGFVAIAMIASTTVIDVNAIADEQAWNKAEVLVGKMTNEQKAAQMLQPNVSTVTTADVEQYQFGSVLSGGGEPPVSGQNSMNDWANAIDSYQTAAIKGTSESNHGTAIPLLYGVDAVHGNNNVYGATIFPHNIGLGATQDASIVEKIGKATASETKATGANWAFAPLLGVPHNERWGRTYETFGDNYETVAKMGVAYVKGIESGNKVLSTAKHYVGEGLTTNGTNQGDVTMSSELYKALIAKDLGNDTVKEILTPYIDAINAGTSSIMVSYNSINNVKCHGNKDLINDLLKGKLGFKGIVISDYNGIDQITEVSGYENKVIYSVNAGLDMLMVAGNEGSTTKWKAAYDAILAGLEDGRISQDRVNDACTRIIVQKYKLGIMENPSLAYASEDDKDAFGSDEHRKIARQAVAESLVLLKNTKSEGDEETAMQKLSSAKNVLVAGSNAHNLGNQCGGWTISWQGQSGNSCTEGTTIFQGIQEALNDRDGKAIYAANGYYEGDADFAIVVAGESPYAETNGDKAANELKLSKTDLNTIQTIKEDHPDLPIVLVLVTGRPLTIADQVTDDSIKAIVSAWLPGSEGAGVADVLFGEKDFTGKNPITWPYYAKDIETKLTDESKVLYKTGYGLTKAEVSADVTDPGDPNIIKFNTTGTTKIETENYVDSYSASDQLKLENGGTTVGNYRDGSWVAYKISTEKDAVYDLVANLNANTDVANAFQLLIDDKVILDNTMTVPGQGDWTTFKPLGLGKVSIPAGEHTLKLLSKSKDFNTDWLEFTVDPDGQYVAPQEPVEVDYDYGSGAVLQEGAVSVTMSSGENSGNDWYNGNKKIENKNTKKDSIDLKTVDNPTNDITTINVDHTQEYNTFLGMGTSIDESTINNLWKMNEDNRYAFIKRLVDPESGAGDTLFRLTIGTPDFVACPFYTYYDGTGTELNGQPDWYNETGNGFSIQKDHDYHIIDTVKLIQQVAKDCGVADQIKFFASPWTPPGWMKEETNSSKSYANNELLLKGGKLSDDHIDDAAKYYVRYIEEYAKLGIPVYAMTLQNEPMLEINYPSCAISASQEAKLAKAIKKELKASTVLSAEAKDVKIWAFDHNPGDLNTYMKTVYGDALDSIDGAAVHDYGGELSNMTTLHNSYSDKSIHLTERSVWGTTGMDRITQYFRNYAESYNCWVTMLDSNIQTHQWVGTPDVTAFVQDANDPDHYWATPEVYLMGQFSKYIRPGFIRVQSNYGSSSTVTNVVFKNPETNELIMVVTNNTDSDQNFRVINNGVQFNAVLPAKNTATYIWKASNGAPQGLTISATGTSTLHASDAKTVNGMKQPEEKSGSFENVEAGANATYLVDVQEAGYYNVTIKHAIGPSEGPSIDSNTEQKELVLSVDEEEIGQLLTKRFDTWSSGWDAWGTYRDGHLQVYLDAGIQNLKITSNQASININDLVFTKAKENTVPGYINAADYSYGENILIEETDGKTNIGYVENPDFFEYRLNVQNAGTYTMKVEYGSKESAAFDLYLDDSKTPLLTNVTLETTGDWSNYKTASVEGVKLPEGEHTLRFVPQAGKEFNFRAFSFGSYISDLIINSDDGKLKENSLTNQTITVTLSDGKFVDQLDSQKWTLKGLPGGAPIEVERENDTKAIVKFIGEAGQDFDIDKAVTLSIDASQIGEEGFSLDSSFVVKAVDDDESINDVTIEKGATSFEVVLKGGTFNPEITTNDVVLSDSLTKYLTVKAVSVNEAGNLVVEVDRNNNYVNITGTVTIKANGYSDGNLDLEANVSMVKNADPKAIEVGKDSDGKIIVGHLTTENAYDTNGSFADPINGASKGDYESFYLDVKEAGDYVLSFNVSNNAEMSGALKINGGKEYRTDNLKTISFGKYWNNTNVSYRTLLTFNEAGQYTIQLEANADELKIANAQLSLKPEAIEINSDYTLGVSQIIDGSTDKLWAIEANNNVGYTGVDAYQDYYVDVTKGGQYSFSINYATEGTDSVAELISVVDGKETSLGTIDLESTGGWSNYADSKQVDIELPKGTQILRFKVNNGGFNTQSIKLIKDGSEPVEVIKPEISAENDGVKVYVGSEDNIIDLLGIKVMYDGKDVTTDLAKVAIETEFDSNKAGEYKVKVVAKDSKGEDVTKEFTITVVNKATLTYNDANITVGSEFDPMDNIVVKDIDGSDITDKVTIKENNVDLSKAGTYTIVYSVVDGLGNTVTFEREVKVVKVTTEDPDKSDTGNGQTPDSNKPSTGKPVTVIGTVKTGDEMNILPYAMFIGLSLLGILYVLKKRKID